LGHAFLRPGWGQTPAWRFRPWLRQAGRVALAAGLDLREEFPPSEVQESLLVGADLCT